MSYALITGATSGIGAAFARQLAAEGNDLVLVARNAERLKDTAAELSEAHTVEVQTVPADLTEIEGCERVREYAEAADLLVNNAGMSLGKGFTYASVEEEDRLFNLNVRAVMRLTHAALPGMRSRGHGAIVNVSSVAGFAPVMPGSTYNASKAWVTNFSQSMAPLARKQGVLVMALAPGFVHSEFHDRAGIDVSGVPHWMMLDANFVVEAALRDLKRGKTLSVPSLSYKLIVSGIRHLPHGPLATVASRVDRISRRGRTR